MLCKRKSRNTTPPTTPPHNLESFYCPKNSENISVCVYPCKPLFYLQDKERIYIDVFYVNIREKYKSNVKIMILGLIIFTSISIIQWNLSKEMEIYFTWNEHHLWWDSHWRSISSEEEKTATKLLKQWFEATEEVNDNSLMQNGIGTNSQNGKAYLFGEVKTERRAFIKSENNLKKSAFVPLFY